MIEYSARRDRAFGREVRTRDDVLEYIAEAAGTTVDEVRSAREASESRASAVPSDRPTVPVLPELRDDPKGLTFDGYATTYDYSYPVFGGAADGGFDETIARGAADKSAKEADVVFLLDHGDSGTGMPLARTTAGTLSLASEAAGLRSIVPNLNELRSPDVPLLVASMEDRNATQMSFAFRALRQSWNEDYTQRTITEVKLYDVSLVAHPANDATSAVLRTAEDAAPAAPVGRSLTLAKRQLEVISLTR